MISDQILSYVLASALVNTAVFLFTSYLLFIRYGLPVYHIMGFYQLYHFLGFVLRPWELYLRGDSGTWDYIGVVPSGATIVWATVVMVIAHASMIAGFVITNPRFGPVASFPPINFRVGRPALFGATVVLFLILGAYGSYTSAGNVLQLEHGGGTMIEYDAAGGQRLMNVSGYQTVFGELFTITMIMLFAVRRTRKLSVVLIIAFVGYRTLVGAGRSAFVATLLAVSFIWLINQHRRLPTPRMAIVGAAVLLLFNILGADRSAGRRIVNQEASISDIVSNYFTSEHSRGVTQNMEEFDVFASVLSYVPSETGFTYGTQYLRLLIWPIPRFLWQDKPVFTSNINLLDYANFSILTYTSYADSYMTFGLPGMIVILFTISVVLNRLYRRASQSLTPMIKMWYFVVLAYAAMLFRDGPVAAAYYYLVLGLGAFVLVRAGAIKAEQELRPYRLPTGLVNA